MQRQSFCVSAGHPAAVGIPADVLRDGGNAVNDGVAVCIALRVLQGEKVQLGGIAPMSLNRADEGRVHVLDGVGCWPAQTDPALFRTRDRSRIPYGILRSVAPAAPAAWISARRRFGTRRLAGLAAPAARLAADGFVVHAEMATLAGGLARFLSVFEGNCAIWMRGGKARVIGEVIRIPDLAATRRAPIAADRAGAARDGRRAGLDAAEALFCRGEIAAQMLRHVAGTAPASTLPQFAAPGRLQVEEDFDPSGMSALAARGHRIVPVGRRGVNTASVCLVAPGPAGREATGDPRRASIQIIEAVGGSG